MVLSWSVRWDNSDRKYVVYSFNLYAAYVVYACNYRNLSIYSVYYEWDESHGCEKYACSVVDCVFCVVCDPGCGCFLLANGYSAFSSLLDLSFSDGAYGFCIILGYLIRKGVFDRIKTEVLILVGLVSFGLTVFMQIYSDMHGVDYNVWYDAAPLILADLSIFLLISKMKFASGKIATNISICAFGMYLVHCPVIMILFRYFEPASRVVRLGVGVLVTFLISWGIVFAGSKIKGVSRILFFIKS